MSTGPARGVGGARRTTAATVARRATMRGRRPRVGAPRRCGRVRGVRRRRVRPRRRRLGTNADPGCRAAALDPVRHTPRDRAGAGDHRWRRRPPRDHPARHAALRDGGPDQPRCHPGGGRPGAAHAPPLRHRRVRRHRPQPTRDRGDRRRRGGAGPGDRASRRPADQPARPRVRRGRGARGRRPRAQRRLDRHRPPHRRRPAHRHPAHPGGHRRGRRGPRQRHLRRHDRDGSARRHRRRRSALGHGRGDRSRRRAATHTPSPSTSAPSSSSPR